MYLNKKYRIICEDMESISIYKIANMYNIPVISVKIISNNEILNEKYDRNTGIEVQKFTEDIIKSIR